LRFLEQIDPRRVFGFKGDKATRGYKKLKLIKRFIIFLLKQRNRDEGHACRM
jgi:hypothetical protein